MCREGKRTVVQSIVRCVIPIFLLMFFVGCEELLQEALTRDITIEEEIFESQTLEGAGETTTVSVSDTVEPIEEYTQYIDRIQDVSSVEITGSATNNGNGTVTLTLSIICGDANWEGSVDIPTGSPNNVVQFADWFNSLPDDEKDAMNECMFNFTEDNLTATLTLASDHAINVFIDTVILKGTIEVSL